MSVNDYFKSIKDLDQLYNEEKQKIAKNYALDNNIYKIGDTVSDGKNKIIIDKIFWSTRNFENLPCCIYEGNVIRKNKLNKKLQIWQYKIINEKRP